MATPARMNLVAVVIKQLSAKHATPTKSTLIDADFGEPMVGVRKPYEPNINVNAQIVYGTKDKQVSAMSGDPGDTKGHLTFRKSDLDTAGIIINKGDIILSIAGVAVDYKITEARPSGHLRGKANLIMAFFDSNEETNTAFRR